MGRKVVRLEREKISQAIGENCACYVLITCSTPTKDGKMNVEMQFEGDESLAAFLIESASHSFESTNLERESQ